jgi:hypothetical protein
MLNLNSFKLKNKDGNDFESKLLLKGPLLSMHSMDKVMKISKSKLESNCSLNIYSLLLNEIRSDVLGKIAVPKERLTLSVSLNEMFNADFNVKLSPACINTTQKDLEDIILKDCQ